MKVSVLIPTYNRAYIVGEALESALAQTHQDLEIIVIDDGSTDNTRELVEGFRSNKIRYVRLERNRGNSVACNTGIRAATGAAIAFLDSDDIWRPTNLERQVGFLLRHPEVDAVFTDCTIVDGEQTIPSLISLMQAFPKLIKDEGHTLSLQYHEQKKGDGRGAVGPTSLRGGWTPTTRRVVRAAPWRGCPSPAGTGTA